uniref:Putative secreted protein n=1 Tax=Rhipicephalus microplus TaxID=6941 RepID=A0A6G5A3L7_RHIMP
MICSICMLNLLCDFLHGLFHVQASLLMKKKIITGSEQSRKSCRNFSFLTSRQVFIEQWIESAPTINTITICLAYHE